MYLQSLLRKCSVDNSKHKNNNENDLFKQLNLCPCKNSFSVCIKCHDLQKEILMHSILTANYIITSVPQLLLVVTLATYNITITTTGDETAFGTKWRILTRFYASAAKFLQNFSV